VVLSGYAVHPSLPPSPTRRSSDLRSTAERPEPTTRSARRGARTPVPDKGTATLGATPPGVATLLRPPSGIPPLPPPRRRPDTARDRKSTRLNSSHVKISYAAVCLK